MAYPPFAQTQTSYTAFQQAQGDNSFPGQQVDADLANLAHAVDTLNQFVRGFSRSDGRVGNQTIGYDQLKPELSLGLKPPVLWAAATSFAAGDTAFERLSYYRATADHTSSVSFAADLAAGLWEELIAFESSLSAGLESLVEPIVEAMAPGIVADALAQVPGIVNPLIDAATDDLADTLHGWVTPLLYNAVGDGMTDDTGAYSSAQAAATALFLPDGKTFKIGPTAPTKRVTGPGALLFTDGSANSATVSGFDLTFDAIQSNVALVPEIWAEKAISFSSSPSTGNPVYFNVAIAPGSNIYDGTAVAWRSLLLGHATGQYIKSWERTEAVGNGAMRFAQYSDRNTAIGSLAMQWIGATSRQHLIDTAHDFWRSDVGVPGTPPWDFGGLETRNPGIGATIQAWNTYATGATEVLMNAALGRDALLHVVRGVENIGIGYQSLTNLFDGNYNVAIGVRALRDSVFGIGNTAIGRSAGVWHQEGFNNVFLGRQAGESLVVGSGNIFLGYRAGTDFGASHDNMFVVQAATSDPLLAGSLSGGAVVAASGLGTTLTTTQMHALPRGFYSGIGSVMPAAAGRFTGVTTDSVATLVSTLGTGITASRTHAVFEYADGTVLGSITSASGNVAYNTSSDARVKLDRGREAGALDKIGRVPVRRYSRLGTEDVEEVGFFAHELQVVAPWAVTGEPDAVDANGQPVLQLVDYGKTTPLLWAAMIEMKGRLEALEAQRK